MKFYLSSFNLGDKASELVRLMGKNKKLGYVPNACDFTNVNLEKKESKEKEDIKSLKEIGLEVTYVDLKKYFGKENELKKKINSLGGLFFKGGNTFILRQAMKLSGFDKIFEDLKKREDFVYSGYSAGICVLAPDFKAIQHVDDPTDHPYEQQKETIWEGLNYLDYIILPHYKSNHPESELIDKEIEFCEKNNIPYKTLKDGEVIILE